MRSHTYSLGCLANQFFACGKTGSKPIKFAVESPIRQVLDELTLVSEALSIQKVKLRNFDPFRIAAGVSLFVQCMCSGGSCDQC